jgi:ATP-dependent Clp protease protease subunit
MNTVVLEQEGSELLAVDVYKRLLENRIIFISNFVCTKLASDVVASILAKNMENTKEQITIFLNTDDGDIRSVFTIYDAIKLSEAPIQVVSSGYCGGPTTLILAAGTKGKRFCSPNSVIELGPLTYDYGTQANLEEISQINNIMLKENDRYIKELSKCIKRPVSELKTKLTKLHYLTAKEAKSYGILDSIL